MSRIVYIYCIVDTRRTKESGYYYRYIGKSVHLPKERLKEEIYEAKMGDKTHRSCLIRKMLQEGHNPEVDLIEITDEENWSNREIFQIADFRANGHHLVNHAIGGQGSSGWKHTEEWKKNASLRIKGKPNPGISKALKGRAPQPCVLQAAMRKNAQPEIIEKRIQAVKNFWDSSDGLKRRKELGEKRKGKTPHISSLKAAWAARTGTKWSPEEREKRKTRGNFIKFIKKYIKQEFPEIPIKSITFILYDGPKHTYKKTTT